MGLRERRGAKVMNISPKFKSLRTSNARYHIITGGRASGKSYSVSTNLLLLTYESKHVILFTRYTMTSAEISIIPEFVEKINTLGVASDFEITRNEIVNIKTGSKILFRGIKGSSGNQTANLKSINGVTTFVVDEAEELVDESIFTTIDESVRVKDRTNRCIIILNPTTKVHWVYKRFFMENGVQGGFNGEVGDTNYIHTSYLDNIENLSESFLRGAEKLKIRRPDEYNNRYLGAWLDKSDGVVFENWILGEFKDTDSMVYGQDYGFKADASTLTKISIDHDNNKIYIKELMYKHGMSTGDLYTANRHHCGNDLIIADSAEPRLIAELDSLGLNIEGAKKGPGSINFGIKLMQGYDLVIDPMSENLITELKNYAWQSSGEKPIDNFNHIIDGVRYGVTHLIEESHRGVYNIG